MSSVADYIGRSYDLLMLQGFAPDLAGVSQRVVLGLVDDQTGGKIVTGIQELAQAFLLTLLTEQGSIKYDPLYGTRFMTDARQGRWRTPADIQQSFYSALVDVKRQIRGSAPATQPDDQALSDATIDNITIDFDRASFSLTVVSTAGTAAAFIVPIPLIVFP